MEFDAQAVERKFRESYLKGVMQYKDGSTKQTAAYVNAVENTDDGCLLHCTVWRDLCFEAKILYIDTWRNSASKFPKFVPTYWNPDNGLYWTYDKKIVVVTRRVRRSFQVGLSNHAYNIKDWLPNGSQGESHNAINVDILRPRVFQHPDVFTPNLFRKGDGLFFNNHRIGVMNNNIIYLNDSDYVHFLPDRIKESCTINH